MKRDNTISVVMATYNGSMYIRDQIKSIINQTILPSELIVVDDFSHDDTAEIVQEYADTFSFIRLIRLNKNVGVINAFEIGLKNTAGQIVFLCDQDDIWSPFKIKNFIAEFDDPKVACVLGNLTVVFENGSPSRPFFQRNPKSRFTIFQQFIKNDFIGCNMAIRRNVITRALPFPKRISMHDWWLAVVSLSVGSAVFLDLTTMNYRRHSSTVTSFNKRPLSVILSSRLANLNALIKLLSRTIYWKV